MSAAVLQRSALVRYGASALIVGMAVLIRLAFESTLGNRVPFTGVLAAVVIAAWIGGRGPGLLAVALGALLSWYYFLPKRHSFVVEDSGDAVQLGMFVVVAIALAFLSAAHRTAKRAVLELENNLADISANSPEIIFTADPNGQIHYLTDGFREYTGRDKSGTSLVTWIDLLHPEDDEQLSAAWTRSMGMEVDCRVSFRLRGRNGSYRWFQLHAVPLRQEDGAVRSWIGICTDIDAHKQREDELIRANRELTRSNEDLQRFAHVASHDLQEPLRQVSTYSKLIARTHSGSENDSEEFLVQIQMGVSRMQQLIQDLLQYARVTSQDHPPPKLISLGEPLTEALWNLQATITDSGAKVTYGSLPQVKAIPRLITQVFQNLISNALKYRGEKAPEIRIEARRQDADWIISVIDSGIGIPNEYLERVFRPFFRLHSGGQYSGTGIGLAIVKRCIERHGGSVWVESEPGRGATFSFTLSASSTESYSIEMNPSELELRSQ